MAQEMSIKRVLLSDVAKLAGLSKATLSRYMNNSIVLPQDTIDRIETAIRELDYRGNSRHAVLAKAAAKRLARCFPILPTPSLPNWPTQPKRPLLPAATAGAVYYPQQPGKRVPVHSLAGYLPVDGLLFTTNRPDNGLLRKEVQRHERIVLLDEDIPGSKVPKVFADNVRAGGSPPKN